MIIETLGLCYHLPCFKVSLSQRACRHRRPATPRFAWRAHGFYGPWGCGCATNKLGAVICLSVCLSVLPGHCKWLATTQLSDLESSYKSQPGRLMLFVPLICQDSINKIYSAQCVLYSILPWVDLKFNLPVLLATWRRAVISVSNRSF